MIFAHITCIHHKYNNNISKYYHNYKSSSTYHYSHRYYYIGNFTHLVVLNLSYNMIEGAIPENIYQLYNLYYLDIIMVQYQIHWEN